MIQSGIPVDRILKVDGPVETENVQKALIEKTIERFGRLDVLVNNAGSFHKDGLDTKLETLENFDYVFSLNVRA